MSWAKQLTAVFFKGFNPAAATTPSLSTDDARALRRGACGPPYRWELSGNGLIRTVDDPEDCPVTAVARYLTGRRYPTGDQWQDAAKAIGLPTAVADGVMRAADKEDVDGLRKRLLIWTKLEELSTKQVTSCDLDTELTALVASAPSAAPANETKELVAV